MKTGTVETNARTQPDMNHLASPSRTYVAMMYRAAFQGFYFRKFSLPANLTNNVGEAARLYYEQNVKPSPSSALNGWSPGKTIAISSSPAEAPCI